MLSQIIAYKHYIKKFTDDFKHLQTSSRPRKQPTGSGHNAHVVKRVPVFTLSNYVFHFVNTSAMLKTVHIFFWAILHFVNGKNPVFEKRPQPQSGATDYVDISTANLTTQINFSKKRCYQYFKQCKSRIWNKLVMTEILEMLNAECDSYECCSCWESWVSYRQTDARPITFRCARTQQGLRYRSADNY